MQSGDREAHREAPLVSAAKAEHSNATPQMRATDSPSLPMFATQPQSLCLIRRLATAESDAALTLRAQQRTAGGGLRWCCSLVTPCRLVSARR